jgi:hypothetical protein
LVLILAAAMALALVAVLPGCGENENVKLAKQLMEDGDKNYNEVEVTKDALSEKQTEIATAAMEGDYSSLTGEAGEQLQMELEQLMSELQSNLGAAKANYEQILELEDAEDYKEYAGKMVEVIDKDQELVTAIEALMAKFQEMIAMAAQGQQVDIMSLLQSEEMSTVTELTEEIDSLLKEAENIKSEKNL